MSIRNLFITFISIILMTFTATAQMKIDVVGGKVSAIPIAIPNIAPVKDMEVDGLLLSDIGASISKVITSNLQSTGLFRALPHNSFIETKMADPAFPQFAKWKPIGAHGLVSGRILRRPDGRLGIEFRLWDVSSRRMLDGLSYTTVASDWRRIAHAISDKIYSRMTGDDGYFDSRIVYIAESGSATNRVKRLAIMDQDGENQQYITDGSYLVLTPRFSPNQQVITFLSYYNNRPRVYLLNLVNNNFEILGDFEKNMTFAPRFSPDGNKVVMSLSDNGNSDVYVMDLRTRKNKRLTSHPGIDTSPSYSPDGSKIVFNSDRGGSQQLYVMDADGSNIKRISFGRGRYATPVWSPRGDLIAFTKIGERKFRIGVMKPNGKGERLLTNAYQDEGPTWSPNGRVLMFFRTERGNSSGQGRSTLWSVDLTGYNEKKVKTIGDASDPEWSPPLPITNK